MRLPQLPLYLHVPGPHRWTREAMVSEGRLLRAVAGAGRLLARLLPEAVSCAACLPGNAATAAWQRCCCCLATLLGHAALPIPTCLHSRSLSQLAGRYIPARTLAFWLTVSRCCCTTSWSARGPALPTLPALWYPATPTSPPLRAFSSCRSLRSLQTYPRLNLAVKPLTCEHVGRGYSTWSGPHAGWAGALARSPLGPRVAALELRFLWLSYRGDLADAVGAFPNLQVRAWGVGRGRGQGAGGGARGAGQVGAVERGLLSCGRKGTRVY